MLSDKNKHIEEIELRSEEVQEILTQVPHWMIRRGNVLFLILILLLLAISWFVKYPDIIVSDAIITTEITPQKEYAKISGTFDTIFVRDNQRVKSNTVLAILENTANYDDVLKLKHLIDTLEVRNGNFNFPIDSLSMLFLGDIDKEYTLFENNYLQYLLNKKLQPFANEALANKASLVELRKRLVNLKIQRALQDSEVNFKKEELKRKKSLFKKGIISAQEYENAQSEGVQTERNYKALSTSISQLRESITIAQKTVKSTKINKFREEALLLKKVIQSFNQLKKSIREWEIRYAFIAEIDGTVSYLNFLDKNQTIIKGDLVFAIIPTKNTQFIAKLKAPIQNSGKIKIGQKVNIKLLNYPEEEFGVLKGNVETISLMPDKEGVYIINVILPNQLTTSYDKKIDFKLEMIGSGEIITKDLRLINRFFIDFKKSTKR